MIWWLALIVLGGLGLRKLTGTSREDVERAQRLAALAGQRARDLYDDWKSQGGA